MKLLRTLVVAFLSISLVAVGLSNTSASTATYSDPGVATESSDRTWGNTLTFEDPNVTATFSRGTASFYYQPWHTHCMTTDACGWWGVDDAAGINCNDYWSHLCDWRTSERNSRNAYIQPSIATTRGVGWTWRTTLCGNIKAVDGNGNLVGSPSPQNPEINCLNVDTVTIEFSAPVSNAIIHLANIGGAMQSPCCNTPRSTDFLTGFDTSTASKWTLTSGQEIVQLSGSETTNLILDGNTIRPKYVVQGPGARPGVGPCVYNDPSCRYRNGTGHGSFLVLGTYSRISFDIDLWWNLVNYGPNNDPATFATANKNGFDNVEGVAVQISFYKSGPLIDTPSTTTTTSIPPVVSGSSNGSSTAMTELPATGATPLLAIIGFAILGLGGALVVRRRAL